MTPPSLYEPTLALAGAIQATTLVQQLAREGECDKSAFETSINSIYQLNPESTLSVYGDEAALQLGLKQIVKLFQSGLQKQTKEFEVTRYLFGLFHLERKLSKNHAMLDAIAKEIEQANRQANYFSTTHPNLISKLAEIYLATISKFRFRLQIVGKVNYLQRDDILNQIRALLLAGIRSAMLWRQLGGSRWQLLFKRKHIVATAKTLLDRC